jgi:hypothetical protein
MPNTPDLIALVVQPLERSLGQALSAGGWPPGAVEAVVGLLRVAEVGVLVVLLGSGGAALRRMDAATATRGRGSRTAVAGVYAGTGGVAVALFAWMARHPAADIVSLIGRLDHLAFCAIAGCALSRLSSEARKWALALLSLYIVGQHTGWTAVRLVVSGGLLGFALVKLRTLRNPWMMAGAQAIVLLGMYLTNWHMRSANLLAALVTQGVLAFVLLRHISFVVEAQRGVSASLGDYLCYMFFYPSCVGASEIYSEFSERNLGATVTLDYGGAAHRIVVGWLQIWLGHLIPASVETAVEVQTTALLWPSVLALFVRSALTIMGLWAIIEGCALLYGVRLRPNFAGILGCENPSQFWRSWRGTMTNWLIHYVYIPLGGNRRAQGRNILAAFAVSTVWHWSGIPFLALQVGTRDFVPVALWGLLNALAVIGYVVVRRRGWQLLPDSTPPPIRRGVKLLLTMCLGTFTVTLLGFQPKHMDQFIPFVRALFGLGPP